MKKIASVLLDAKKIALIIHVNPDSDCVGSAAALALTLRNMGKKADIFCDSDIPNRLSFLVKDKELFGPLDSVYDVCLCVDVAENYMMGKYYGSLFKRTGITCCIDHHGTNSGYAEYNYIDPEASAAGEILYFFIKDYLGQPLTFDSAACLYAAIAGDTGSFRYSNTTCRTHRVAGELIGYGIDNAKIMRLMFEQKTAEQLKLNAEVISGLEFFENGKICVATVDEAMLCKYGINFGEADDIASIPRQITGVEVGVYIKVKGDSDCKLSLRSNEYVDVAEIAKNLGGGGHIRAAGVTLNMTKDDAKRTVLEEIKKVI